MPSEQDCQFILAILFLVIIGFASLRFAYLLLRDFIDQVFGGSHVLATISCVILALVSEPLLDCIAPNWSNYLCRASLVALSLGVGSFLLVLIVKWAKIIPHWKKTDKKYWQGHCSLAQTMEDWQYDFPSKAKVRDGWAFEFFIRDFLEDVGFTNVEVIGLKKHTTKEGIELTGDHGADVIGYAAFRRYVVQCKHYKEGNKAEPEDVREITAARSYYGASCAILVSTSGFTDGAIYYAKKTQVVLIDGSELSQVIESGGKKLFCGKDYKPWQHLNPFSNFNQYVSECPSFDKATRVDAIKTEYRDEYESIMRRRETQ